MAIRATVARTSLGILRIAGATASESSPAEEKQESRSAVWAGHSQPLGSSWSA